MLKVIASPLNEIHAYHPLPCVPIQYHHGLTHQLLQYCASQIQLAFHSSVSLIPAFDFCIPDKECVTSGDNPCELFRKIDFPTDEFFPPKASDCGCGCGRQN